MADPITLCDRHSQETIANSTRTLKVVSLTPATEIVRCVCGHNIFPGELVAVMTQEA